MPEYRHPRASDDVSGRPPERVHVTRARKATVDGGVFTAPASVARSIAAAHGTTEAAMRVDDTETCTAVKSDGEVCGREKPCPYHDDEEGGD